MPHVEPFFAMHGDHAHAVTSELFPVLSRPCSPRSEYAVLYVAARARVHCDARRVRVAGLGARPAAQPGACRTRAALGTPFVFYGLEFWEHATALAMGVGGVALLLAPRDGRPGRHSRAVATLGAGVMCGACDCAARGGRVLRGRDDGCVENPRPSTDVAIAGRRRYSASGRAAAARAPHGAPLRIIHSRTCRREHGTDWWTLAQRPDSSWLPTGCSRRSGTPLALFVRAASGPSRRSRWWGRSRFTARPRGTASSSGSWWR